MVIFLLLLLLSVSIISLYRRLVPVRRVPCTNQFSSDTPVLDIRDYTSKPELLHDQYQHIPYAYLKRFINEVAPGRLHLIASE